MALKAILDSLDGVDDATAKLYRQGSGDLADRFVLDVEVVDGHGIAGFNKLQTALNSERQNRRAAEAKLKAFEGIEDPEAARDALSRVGSIGDMVEKDKLEAAVEGIKRQLLEKHSAELGTRDTRISTLEQALDSALGESKAVRALDKLGANVDLLLPHVLRRVKVVEEDGRFMEKVVDPATGEAILSKRPGDSGDMGIEELVESMSNDPTYALAFNGHQASGSGETQDSTSTQSGGRPNGSQKVISRHDDKAFSQNLEAIAKGEVTVVDE